MRFGTNEEIGQKGRIQIPLSGGFYEEKEPKTKKKFPAKGTKSHLRGKKRRRKDNTHTEAKRFRETQCRGRLTL